MPTAKTKARQKASKPNAKAASRSVGTQRPRKSAMTVKTTASAFNKLIVVGIGASAGGLEAYKHVLPGLPNNANMAFEIVQQLDPKHRSMMVSLLDRHTNMEAAQAYQLPVRVSRILLK
jgi:chemotaxis response regulator CheB